VLSLFLGLYPKPVLDRIEPTVKAKIARLEHKTDYREPQPPSILKQSAKSPNASKKAEGSK
jgi:hypothetical protein